MSVHAPSHVYAMEGVGAGELVGARAETVFRLNAASAPQRNSRRSATAQHRHRVPATVVAHDRHNGDRAGRWIRTSSGAGSVDHARARPFRLIAEYVRPRGPALLSQPPFYGRMLLNKDA
jgi:hypothetical protein